MAPKFFPLLLTAVLFRIVCAGGLSASGTTSAAFLLVNVPAREASLGGIYAVNYARPAAATANPAVLCGIKSSHLTLSHYVSVFNTNYEQFIFAAPLSEKSAWQAAFLYSGNSDLYRTDDMGYPVEYIDNYDIYAGGAYAFEFSRELNLGIGAKLLFLRAYTNTDIGAVLNLGALYRNFDLRYMIGLSVENLGAGIAAFTDGIFYPLIIRAGYGTELYRHPEDYRISLFIEERVYLNENEGAETTFALEAEYRRFFVFRYGYVFGMDEGRVALGAGVKFRQINIDYAYQPFFLSDNAHRFSVEIIF
ncbi:MAG TPA: PorV/PorQ family protein [bacterium]|nr:PorV/PorQ family protein [bacterium]